MRGAQFEVFPGSESELAEHDNEQFYWRLRASNGQVIAVGGEGFATKAGAYRAIGTVQGAVIDTTINAVHDAAEQAAVKAEAPA